MKNILFVLFIFSAPMLTAMDSHHTLEQSSGDTAQNTLRLLDIVGQQANAPYHNIFLKNTPFDSQKIRADFLAVSKAINETKNPYVRPHLPITFRAEETSIRGLAVTLSKYDKATLITVRPTFLSMICLKKSYPDGATSFFYETFIEPCYSSGLAILQILQRSLSQLPENHYFQTKQDLFDKILTAVAYIIVKKPFGIRHYSIQHLVKLEE